ncbi:MAG: Eco57I restriction-modification methylase domain-containing protein [Syntrophobacterales bacterium]|nr:Eco57I restriction-modification methylase domain-containing protein [Syntrophobacterales bacterium]
MRINVTDVRQCLKSFDFKTLFREHLGWDNYQAALEIPVDGRTIFLSAIAQKRGFVAFVCDGPIPDRAVRLKIDHQTTKSVHEHFVIYADRGAGQQVWQWVRREQGKPLASRDHRFDIRQSGDPLIQRLDQIAVSLDEEEQITVVDVAGRTRAAFDVDRITKRFYDRFKTEHAAFLDFITGIKAVADLQWYTSLMLNRLMFIYFIQKKGFLDGDTDYLRNRLKMVEQARGRDKFQSFYRYFLLRLFQDGLGRSPEERRFDPIMEKLLGKVPYLNGGFFEVHDLEKRYPEIDIPDKAFENLFDFFDRYNWHLDERPLRADNEINPDVVGYIFEKYINQKQMGAYYTKEDITEYISKNTVIPFIFDAAQKKCAIAFNPDGALWRLLRDNPERYIYSAVLHGVLREDGSLVSESELPDFVQKGMHDPEARMHENRYNLQQAPGGDPIRLVTETWREYVYRRTRCLEVHERLQRGEVCQINDLITLNLDIWQLARDAIINAEGPELLRAFWYAIEKLTVLDPTCGSGAFLFAALRILETLYGDCLERMERFIEDLEGKPHHPEQYSDFKKVLARIEKHPNERYFILKSIIINNLYGVDIMEEAVEICKLRLFLKLVAQVETAEQIEPLPDVDFNIRAGNTLVGYATADQVRKAFTEERQSDRQVQGRLLMGEDEDNYKCFEDDMEIVKLAFREYRHQQTTYGGRVTHKDKLDLRKRLAELDAELDRNLVGEYGITPKNYGSKSAYEQAFNQWKESHQPLHWFVEFYGIMSAGGFDVIIGNPPYVEYRNVRQDYCVHNFATECCGNLFAFVIERSFNLGVPCGRFGMIVPISIASSDRMSSVRAKLMNICASVWLSNFAIRPQPLFAEIMQRNTIAVAEIGPRRGGRLFSTNYLRWSAAERETLFARLCYSDVTEVQAVKGIIPKVASHPSESLLRKIINTSSRIGQLTGPSSGSLYFHDSGESYWTKTLCDKPVAYRNGVKVDPSQWFPIQVLERERAFVYLVLNSNLFYWLWTVYTDCRHMTRGFINDMPLPTDRHCDNNLLDRLHRAYDENTTLFEKRQGYKSPEITVHNFKPLLDEIDKVLAQHYGFTDEELDFIINYDINYRMGNTDDENGDDG